MSKRSAKHIKPLQEDRVDFSKFVLYDRQQEITPLKPRRRKPRLSFRVPPEILRANGLSLSVGSQCKSPEHTHCMVVINGLELCPVSAVLFLMATRGFSLTTALSEAIQRILEVSKCVSTE